MYISHVSCCGIREIGGLGDHKSAENAMKQFCKEIEPQKMYNNEVWHRNKFRYAVFSGTARSKYVDRFAAYIRDNNLGTVLETDWNVNPNTGNKLRACIWTINHLALKDWAVAHDATVLEPPPKEATNGPRSASPQATPDPLR